MPLTSGGDHKPRAWWQDVGPGVALTFLLALALTVGGGGVSATFGNAAVQLTALAILATFAPALIAFARTAPRALVWLAALSSLLPLVQLVPLPPELWRPLPGRAMVSESLALSGASGWFPVSVAPARTLVAFFGTIAPLTILAIGCTLPAERIVALQRATVAMGVAIGLFGTTHLINDRWGDLYAEVQAMPGILVGTFADRNAAALFFGGCLLLLVGLPGGARNPQERILGWTAGGFLTICVLLTGSRSGIALLAFPAVLLIGGMLSRSKQVQHRAGRSPLWLVVAALVVAGLGTAVLTSGRVQSTIERTRQGDDGMRAEMREDARFAAARYWPAGAGMGTFDEVFQIDESLEYVSPKRAGRAHMDYLELAIEAGLVGLTLAAGWLAWLAWASWRAIRRTGAWPARAAALILAGIAAQSLLSFPLRNQAMLCFAAFAMVLLVRSPVASQGDPPRRPI